MIDIITGMDGAEKLAGTESNKGLKVVGALVLLCVVAAAAGGMYWYKTHHTHVGVVTPQQAIAAVETSDAAWAKAAEARDINGVLSYYADNAYVLAPNQEAATKVLDIRKIWSDLLVKGTDLSWTPGAADISSSGDLVYLEGYYIKTTTLKAKGKAAGEGSIDRGKYLEIWKKQADGSWKCVADTWNSDLGGKKS